ncbi:hypothetical protein CNYM01_12275 [Colletotrichum nymphaeae SA-01]|uniref:Uncharacterized protein n=1 Tax=Colletotrichum nymphaeae SA-01 TaxID=1460502 RepID=A0A135SCY3_9PEZI|nr:hypothetical protein CNYM01_12275 [Colletotrichum nymphaeae SA-01]
MTGPRRAGVGSIVNISIKRRASLDRGYRPSKAPMNCSASSVVTPSEARWLLAQTSSIVSVRGFWTEPDEAPRFISSFLGPLLFSPSPVPGMSRVSQLILNGGQQLGKF